MTHFLFLISFAFFVAVAFGIFSNGTVREKFLTGLKVFAQFVGISLIMAWIFYYIP